VLQGGDFTPEMKAANAALAAVRAEINKIEMEKSRLEADSDLGGIKGARAKNELAQLLSRDMTDLNRALLTAEAAVRKVFFFFAQIWFLFVLLVFFNLDILIPF
jgi:hypothetical protein